MVRNNWQPTRILAEGRVRSFQLPLHCSFSFVFTGKGIAQLVVVMKMYLRKQRNYSISRGKLDDSRVCPIVRIWSSNKQPPFLKDQWESWKCGKNILKVTKEMPGEWRQWIPGSAKLAQHAIWEPDDKYGTEIDGKVLQNTPTVH